MIRQDSNSGLTMQLEFQPCTEAAQVSQLKIQHERVLTKHVRAHETIRLGARGRGSRELKHYIEQSSGRALGSAMVAQAQR